MFCLACGAKADENTTFCAKCGVRLTGRAARLEPRLAGSDSAVPRQQAGKVSKTALIIVLASVVVGMMLLGLVAAILIPKMRSSVNVGRYVLVLQVLTDDSINVETDRDVSRMEELFKKNDLTFAWATKDGLAKYSLRGILANQEGKTRDLLDQYARDWDYSFIGNSVTLTLKPLVAQFLRDQAVREAIETIRNRIDQLGVAGPHLHRGDADKLMVELPRVDNPERIKELIKVAAVFEWKLVKAGPAADEATLLQPTNGQVPDDAQVVRGDSKRGQGGYYLVDKVAVVTGKDLRTIRRTQDEQNSPAVSFTLNAEAGARFEQVTGANIGKAIAIILDGKVQSAPTIEDRISRNQGGIIRGRFTAQEADNLVIILKAGSLPCPIRILEEKVGQ
jgi:preprotein translocase subunit SecD